MTIAGIILAAGSSERLGRPKQLVACQGEPLVRAIAKRVRVATDATCVVLGSAASDIRPALDDLAVDVVVCAAWRDGMSASLRAGIQWACNAGHDAVVVCACDQPGLETSHVKTLIAIHQATQSPVASGYDGTAGVPALFPRAWFDRLGRLEGDRGARSLLGDAAVVEWPDGAFDLDTPEELASWLSSQ
jgi:molybdenum cofactor cytidylyltransferase